MIESVSGWLSHQFTSNDVFAGLVGGSALASAIFLLRSAPKHFAHLWLLNFTCELAVQSEDEAFVWLNEWMAAQPFASRSRRLKLSSFNDFSEEGEHREHWSLAPGYGKHFFVYRRRLVCVDRMLQETQSGGSGAGGRKRMETISVRLFGRDSSLLRALVAEAREVKTGGRRTAIFMWRGYWQRAVTKRPRPLSSVFLPQDQIEGIVADIDWFLGASKWYRKRGVPWRRGYLLSGPPGCGKTSLVMGLADRFDMSVYVLNFGSLDGDDALIAAMMTIPGRSILLIEDIDATGASLSRERSTPAVQDAADSQPTEPKRGVTTTALLNAIDGVASKDGRILIMTTNHPEKLDSALIRPGRADRHETIGPIGPQEISRMYQRFFPQALGVGPEREIQPRPAAEVQAAFMLHAADSAAALSAISDPQGAR